MSIWPTLHARVSLGEAQRPYVFTLTFLALPALLGDSGRPEVRPFERIDEVLHPAWSCEYLGDTAQPGLFRKTEPPRERVPNDSSKLQFLSAMVAGG